MSISEFYPFRTRPDSIQLQLIPVAEQVRRSSDGSLLVYDVDSHSVAVTALVEAPETIHNDVLDVSEHEDRPVKIILTCNSVASRHRASLNLNGSGAECSLELEKDDWRGAVEFRACLVRTTDNPALPDGYANKAGALLAWSESTRILFDEPRLPPGDYIAIAWKDFSVSEEWLQRQRDHLFAVDTSGEIPVILLNQGVPQAYQVLNSGANSGTIARIRDATFYMIVHQVWSSLLAETLVSISETRLGDEESIDLVLDELPPWQQALFMDWAPKLCPEEDVAEAPSRLISAIRTGTWSRDLLYRRLPEAIQRQHGTWRGFRRLVQELGNQ